MIFAASLSLCYFFSLVSMTQMWNSSSWHNCHTPNYSVFFTGRFCFQECGGVFNALVNLLAVLNCNSVPTLPYLTGKALGNSFEFILNVFSMYSAGK